MAVERSAVRVLVTASGELDIATADEFIRGLRAAFGTSPVLLDLSGLTFIDSSGIRALDELVRAADEQQWQFRIDSDLRANVRRVLDISGILAVLPLVERPGGEARE
jgi:anti-sigma B factor antagonist